MDYIRALVFVLSLLICCVVFSALATVVAIANPIGLLLLFSFGLLGVLLALEFLDSAFNSFY
jgi:hypothetical protein